MQPIIIFIHSMKFMFNSQSVFNQVCLTKTAIAQELIPPLLYHVLYKIIKQQKQNETLIPEKHKNRELLEHKNRELFEHKNRELLEHKNRELLAQTVRNRQNFRSYSNSTKLSF